MAPKPDNGGSFTLTVLSRYLTHAVVLVIVLTISGYASAGRQSSAPSGIRSDANALVMNRGGQVSDFYLGRFSTIIKPLPLPTSAPASHTPAVYSVSDGEDIRTIAAKFNVTVEEIRWSNPILNDTDRVTGGVHLTIPPTHGLVMIAHSGDSIESIASRFHVTGESIIDYNRLRLDPGSLPDSLELVIPGGKGPQLTIRTPSYGESLQAYSPFRATGGGYKVTIGAPVGSYNSNFPWGWCTYYVSTRRNVTWSGDASYWYAAAQAQGFPVGSSPAPRAIMVTWESGWGHVAYVESVNPDGSWLVSEMNFSGFGVRSQRVIRKGQVPLIGFIYEKEQPPAPPAPAPDESHTAPPVGTLHSADASIGKLVDRVR